MVSKERSTMNPPSKYLTYLEAEGRNLIEKGVYSSEEASLHDLVRDLVKRKIENYQEAIGVYEKKHRSWEEFSQKLSGIATPEQEDEWMEWETARDRLNAWLEVYEEMR
jgi:CRISPR/Cas system-associated endonuclease Cas1